MTGKTQIVPKEPQSEFAALIQQGHSVIRLENDHQSAIAVMRPRDEESILTRILGELQNTPEFAKKVFYSIPYKDRSDGAEKTTWVEGISIGGSMAIARRWGNSATANRILEEKEDRIIVEGVFMDYETNNRVLRQVAVSRFYKPKGSNSMVPLREDRLAIAIQSGMSKAVRNAVLHGIPEGIKIEYLKQAKQIANGEKKDGKIVEKPLNARLGELLEGYEAQGITREEIIKYLGKEKIGEVDYKNLLGLLNAITEGYVKKESIFVPEGEAPKKQREAVELKDVIE